MVDIHWVPLSPTGSAEQVDPATASLSFKTGDRLTAAVLEVFEDRDALLSFDRFKAYARLPVPVAVGQTVHLEVAAAAKNVNLVMLPPKGRTTNAPAGERLSIQLFEPVFDRPSLAAYLRAAPPGEPLQGRVTGFQINGRHLVDFGKFKTFTKIDIPVRQGQIIPLVVSKSESGIALTVVGSPLSSHAENRLVSSAETVLTSQNHASSARRATLSGPAASAGATPSAGKILAASHPRGKTQPPTAGEMVLMRAQVQRILERGVQPVEGGSLRLSETMQKTLSNLQQALIPAATTGDIVALVDRIKAFVEHSGLYFEKHLEQAIHSLRERQPSLPISELSRDPEIRELMVKDLKPNLLILKRFLDALQPDLKSSDRHMLEALRGVVERAVANIEQQQIMATEKPVDPSLLQAFSHLLVLLDTPRNARLNVYYPKKGKEGSAKHPRVALLLDMDRMGAIRADLWAVDKNLNVTFFVKDEKIKTAIDAERHRIGEVLDKTFDTVAVSVVISERKIIEFDDEALSIAEDRQINLSI